MFKVLSICALAVGVLAIPATARADHAGMVMASSDDPAAPPTSSFEAGVSLLAGQFDTTFFAGSYQAVTPAARWSRGRFAATASLAVYHLVENSVTQQGIGDLMLGGSATILDGRAGKAGVTSMVSAPTGDRAAMLGMGHPMIMESVWGAMPIGRVTLTGSLGYNRMIGRMDDMVVAVGGVREVMAMSLVDPMNMSEISWGGGAGMGVGHGVRIGARLGGGIPVGEPGIQRVVGALRVEWGGRRMSTAAELQAGIVGDPYTVRGVVETALRF